MIPDVTPNGVFYLPPTGWLTSFYNPPCKEFIDIYGIFTENILEYFGQEDEFYGNTRNKGSSRFS